MSSKEVEKKLKKAGGEFVRQTGSHRQYKMPNGKLVTVPHPKKDIPLGTLKSIEKQAGIKL